MTQGSLPALPWLGLGLDQLASQGWFWAENALPESWVQRVNGQLDQRGLEGGFRDAAIGRGARTHMNGEVRRDQICWVEHGDALDHASGIWELVETLRCQINRDLFAGLSSFEGHFSIYPPGGFYRRHTDTFRDDDRRFLTLIIYLNTSWRAVDGGQLRLYISGQDYVDISPRAGTVVMFRARQFPHEVLESTRMRRSFTGWFKV
jgi:SM-20-related protein